MERKPDWLPGFPVQIYCNRRDTFSRLHRQGGTKAQNTEPCNVDGTSGWKAAAGYGTVRTRRLSKLLEEVHRIELYVKKSNVQAAPNSVRQLCHYGYWHSTCQTSICSHAYHAIDRRVNNAALAVWKKLFPKRYNSDAGAAEGALQSSCTDTKGYDSKTFAVSGRRKMVWYNLCVHHA